MWELDRLIQKEDYAYEEEISKNPYELENWLHYYSIKCSRTTTSFHNKVFILERAVQSLPKSVELWTIYLELVVGIVESVDSIQYKSQFILVNQLFNRALLLLYANEGIWIKYLKFLLDTQPNELTLIRRTFNKCLVNLPIKSHEVIWPLYLVFANSVGGLTGAKIYHKYLQYAEPPILKGLKSHPNPILNLTIEDILNKFIEFEDFNEINGIYANIINNPDQYISLNKTNLQFWLDYIDFLTDDKYRARVNDDHIEKLVLQGIEQFPDQIGTFYIKLTNYYKSQPDKEDSARYFYDKGIKSCVTIQDFLLIYNAYINFEETILDDLSETLELKPVNEQLSKLLDYRCYYFEQLMDSRPILINDMMLRQDINNLDVWFDRFGIFKDDLNTKLQTYAQALRQINPFKAHSLLGISAHKLSKIWIDYSEIYSSKDDYKTAELIFTKAIGSQFKHPDELADIYINWSEMLLKSDYEDADSRAIEVIKDGLLRSDANVDYEDSSIDVHKRMHRSVKLWAFYLDLLEMFIEQETQTTEIHQVINAYEKLIELNIATPKLIIAYAKFLETWKYYERSFTVFEVGLKLFQDPFIKYEIWNVYLTKILKQIHTHTKNQTGIERIRDLFDQALDEIPPQLSKDFIILYANFEQENKFIMNCIRVLKRGIQILSQSNIDKFNINYKSKIDRQKVSKDKYQLYSLLLDRVEEFQDEIELRKTYEMAIQDVELALPNLLVLTNKFIDYETSTHQYDRVRSLFKYIIKLTKNSADSLWIQWEQFEVKYGNEPTFKEMLRFKRVTKQEFQDSKAFRDALNPMGFVKSSDGPKVSSINASEPIQSETTNTNTNTNPDEIDIDMDM
ncbi:Pre-mRNA-splicing factor SYF1 [Scheffersomyces amazonensis]|uniref:Pre-mRNA-splicing factor SYF1 n=1 Tax=Scheffersomyces amazonensis TaxID=1078765 RepID=UPI00315D5D0F